MVPIWPSSSLDKRQEVDEADWLEHITWSDTSERKSENEGERGEEPDLPLAVGTSLIAPGPDRHSWLACSILGQRGGKGGEGRGQGERERKSEKVLFHLWEATAALIEPHRLATLDAMTVCA